MCALRWLPIRTSTKVRLDRHIRRFSQLLPHWPVPRADVPVVACCVYRSRNSHHVEQMIGQLPADADIRLHALDAVATQLAPHTLSVGPGWRTPLLQRLIDAGSAAADAWLLLFDDDVDFVRPGRANFLDVSVAAGFDIAGASIGVGQNRTYSHTLVGRASVARTVGLVEVGPVVAFSPNAQKLVLPFPLHYEMGWGLDVRWSQLPSLRRGYVDACPVRHYGEIAAAYVTSRELDSLRDDLAEAGLSSPGDIARTAETWRPWQRTAPWMTTILETPLKEDPC